jgi:hypothetical protein
MKIWLSGEGTDIMVKHMGCGPGLWVVLLKNLLGVEILSKNALILCKKENHPKFHLVHPKYPHMLLKYPSKMGYLRCDSRGIFVTGTYPRSGNS